MPEPSGRRQESNISLKQVKERKIKIGDKGLLFRMGTLSAADLVRQFKPKQLLNQGLQHHRLVHESYG